MSNQIYNSLDALQPVVKLLNETGSALENANRVMSDSPINEVLAAALGAGAGGAISFVALYFGGTAGLSAVGITTGLATAGALVGGGMVAGIFVLAAPIAIFGTAGVMVAGVQKREQLLKEKKKLYQEALVKHNAIIKALEEEVNAKKDRLDYLNSLNILLLSVIKDLESDLGYSKNTNNKILSPNI